MKNREDFIRWLNDIEENAPVTKLVYKDLHLWPILKWYLFREWNKNHSEKSPTSKSTYFSKFKTRIVNIGKGLAGGAYLFYFVIFKKKNLDILFTSASSYREKVGLKNVNKFFQPLAEYCAKTGKKFGFADYRVKNFSEYYYKSFHFNVRLIYAFFSSRSKLKPVPENEAIDKIFIKFNQKFNLKSNSKNFHKDVLKILDWADSYEVILKVLNPKFVFQICYYDNQMFGLNLAGYRQNIKTIDVQHGGQGRLHVAYSGFIKTPEEGYNCMPKIFWVWDNYSFKTLNRVFKNNKNHRVLLGGNPWVGYVKTLNTMRNLERDWNKKILLYTLQPITPFLPEIIMQALLKFDDDYVWWFRFHPRMTSDNIQEIKNYIKENNLENKVFYEEPTRLSLPQVLDKTLIHISKFSGCILEAKMMGVPNIIIDTIGKESYSDIIDNKFNVYFPSGDLWQAIYQIDKKPSVKLQSYEPVLKMLLDGTRNLT